MDFDYISYIKKDCVDDVFLFYQVSYSRWEDAVTCYNQGRYLGAIYLAGYCTENMLKYAILKAKFSTFSPINLEKLTHEFKCLKTHDLGRMIHLGNTELVFRLPKKQDYIELIKWKVEWRYSQQTITQCDAKEFLELTRSFMQQLSENTDPNFRIRQLPAL